ncbi:HTH-type transcriptional regulator GntR [Bienertia sinuspersici]
MFKTTNNEAEYEAAIAGLQLCLSTRAKKSFTLDLVSRGENVQANALSRLASSTLQDLKRSVFVEVLPRRSIETIGEYVYHAGPRPQWMA